MQPRTLLVLALVVLALGAFIFFYEKDLPSTDERTAREKKVLRLAEDDVESILIEWDDQQVRLERQRPATETGEGGGEGEDAGTSESSWRITAPMSARADRFTVDGLMRQVADLESNRTLEDYDPGELGLDEPRARVTLQTTSGQEVLQIGAEVPASSDMLVTLAGSGIAHQVGSGLLDELTREPGEWRDKKLFEGTRSEVVAVTLTGPGGTVELAGQDGDFRLAALDDRADEEQVNALLSEITSLRAETFLDRTPLTPEGMGLDPAQGTVEAVSKTGTQPFRLELGHPREGTEGVYYGRADGQIFELETRLAELLGLGVAEWRSKSWSALQVFEIETARFEDSSGVLELSRDDADWKRGEDRVPYSSVSDLLYPISELKGERIVDREEAAALGFDLENPELRISLTFEDKGADEDEGTQGEERLALSRSVEGQVAATTEGREAVLLVAEAEVGGIREQLQRSRDAEPLSTEDSNTEEAPEAAEESGKIESPPE